MIGVGGVVIGAQHRSEALAGAALHGAQEFALVRIARIPTVENADSAPVGDHEGRDVNRLGPRMGRAAAGACHIAAGIAAHRLDADQRTSEDLPRRAIDAVARPAAEGARQRAGHRAEIGDRDRIRIAGEPLDPHGVYGGTARAVEGVGLDGEARAVLRQFSDALARLAGRFGRGGGARDRSARYPLGRAARRQGVAGGEEG